MSQVHLGHHCDAPHVRRKIMSTGDYNAYENQASNASTECHVDNRSMTGRLQGGGMAAAILCQQALSLPPPPAFLPTLSPSSLFFPVFLFAPSSTREPVHRLINTIYNHSFVKAQDLIECKAFST